MFQFQPVEQRLSAPELGNYQTYGLQALALTSEGRKEVCLVPDVSCDPAFVSRLADQCNVLQLDPAQLLDVILDALP